MLIVTVLIVINMKETLLQIVLAAGTGLVGFIFGWKKNNADLCGQRLDALEKSINVYNLIIDDMSKKVEELKTEINKLETQINHLMAEIKSIRKRNNWTIYQ